jgi:hypothetical protein
LVSDGLYPSQTKIIFCLESAQLAAKEKGYNKHFAFLLSDGLKNRQAV